MGRKKKDENAGVNFWEETEKMEAAQETEPETDGLDEALGIQPTEETEEETETESDEEPEKEKSLQEEADDEFMEDISETPVKLTLAQRTKKIAELEESIGNAKTRMSEIESIADLANSTGFRTMVEEVKKQVHGKVDEEDIKTSKDGLKVLEAVLLTEKTVNGFRFQFNEKKSSIKEWDGKIIELKAGQLSVFDGGKTDEDEVKEENEKASKVQPETLSEAS